MDEITSTAAAADMIHMWNRCHGCGAAPIPAARYECQTCPDGPDNDLCSDCYHAFLSGRVKHPMPGGFFHYAEVQPNAQHVFKKFIGSSTRDLVKWTTVPDVDANAPRIEDHFVVRPEFCCDGTSFIGSYAFLIESHSSMLLLTCLHVMSSVAKRVGVDISTNNDSYTGCELPKVVTGVHFYDVFAPNWMAALLGRADSMLVLRDARTRQEEPFSNRDIAAFSVNSQARLSPGSLAERLPNVGDPIWLVVRKGREPNERTVACVVVQQTDRSFVFRYIEDTSSLPPFTSGAPLVDAAGQVVGINVGLGTFACRAFGHANHADSIRRHLTLR